MATLTHQQRKTESQTARTRSFGGCATCRRRHVKCDEQRPSCSTCRYFGLVCEGYEKHIFFDFEASTDDDGNTRFRRPLFTEEERKCMSEQLTASAPPRQASRLLSQIDNECESASPSTNVEVHRGPFGAFKLSQPQSDPPYDFLTDESDDTSPSNTNDWLLPPESALSPWTQNLVQSILEQSDQISVPPSPDIFDLVGDSGRIQEVFGDAPMAEMPGLSMPPQTFQSYHNYQLPAFISGLQIPQPLSPIFNSSIASTSHSVPPDAVLLLRHYATTIISSFTPLRHTKTPWHVLFLPHAKNCLAALTMGEQLDHASLSSFYGTLAISAFSLGGISRSQMWLEQGKLYKLQAREHARFMLKTAYDKPKSAKYKFILMALITMVQVSMFSGNRDQTECYLLEAEKFIRLRGLNRKKSRKVRLLHHCYAFTRVFHESTFMGTISNQRHHVLKAIESSGLMVYGQDNPTFRSVGWVDLRQEMMYVKSLEEGENDLHLERPGLFPYTLYPEIYGIPETWIYLLSQVIRLANEKDDAEKQPGVNSINLVEFMSRAKSIERCINEMRHPSPNVGGPANEQQRLDESVMYNMLEALNNALAIYFYRRIYDMDASMLQQRVKIVRDCLLHCEEADSNAIYGSPAFNWAAFMAACEADEPEVQASFSTWFQNSAQRSGLSSFTDTLKTIEQVWQEKLNNNGTTVTWLDLMKKNTLLQQDT